MIYLDHAATTPMLPSVREAMAEQWESVGNPSSVHRMGQAVRGRLEEARERIAAALDAEPIEVIFTASGTEANNLAIKGGFWARQTTGPRPVVMASSVEHHAVLDPVTWLCEAQGAHALWLGVDEQGHVDPTECAAQLEARHEETSLVSVMSANNEVGTLQPIAELAEIARECGVPMHTDAVQALGSVPVSFRDSGVDAMSIAGHKIGGPLGIGALIARRTFAMHPLVHGGGQEREVRSGTLDAVSIAGLAVAVEAAVAGQATHAIRVAALRERLVAGVQSALPHAVLNGAARRLPGNAHFSFPGCRGDDLLLLLDARGVACSTGSACSAGVSEASHVLLAMGRDEAAARSCLRFSLGRTTTVPDVDAAVQAIVEAVSLAQGAIR